MAARLRTLPAAVAPVLVGTSLAQSRDDEFRAARVRRRAARRAVHPGRHEPLQRLLRRAPRRRHRGPPRPGAGHRRRAGAAAPGARRDLRLVRAGGAVRRLPDRRRRLGDPGVGAASILAGVLYTGGPRPYGYEGLGEVFVFLFFGVVAVTGSATTRRSSSWPGRPSRSRAGRPAGQLRSWWSTTSVTWRPTGARASARWRCGSGANGRARCTP